MAPLIDVFFRSNASPRPEVPVIASRSALFVLRELPDRPLTSRMSSFPRIFFDPVAHKPNDHLADFSSTREKSRVPVLLRVPFYRSQYQATFLAAIPTGVIRKVKEASTLRGTPSSTIPVTSIWSYLDNGNVTCHLIAITLLFLTENLIGVFSFVSRLPAVRIRV